MRLPARQLLFMLITLIARPGTTPGRTANLEEDITPPAGDVQTHATDVQHRLAQARPASPRFPGRRVHPVRPAEASERPRDPTPGRNTPLPGLRPPDRLPPAGTTVVVTPAASSVRLPLGGSGEANTMTVKVAELLVSTFDPRGCQIRIVADPLASPDEETVIPYDVALVAPRGVRPGPADFGDASGAGYVLVTRTAGLYAWDLYVRYATTPLADPGDYLASIRILVEDTR